MLIFLVWFLFAFLIAFEEVTVGDLTLSHTINVSTENTNQGLGMLIGNLTHHFHLIIGLFIVLLVLCMNHQLNKFPPLPCIYLALLFV